MNTKTKLKIAGGLVLAYLLLFKKGGNVVALGAGRFLNQADPRWASKSVGNNGGTYGKIGCVATAVAIAVNMLKGTSLTPDMLQPGKGKLTAADYDGGSISSDQALAKLGCVVRGRVRAVPHTSTGVAMMRALLDDTFAKGGVAIVRVDYDVTTTADNHSVVCFGRTGEGAYKCADPAGGVEVILNTDLFAKRSSSKTYAATGVQPIFKA